MKNLKIAIILLGITALTFYACKKEEITDKEAAQKHFLGRWPLKYRIRTVYDSFTTRIDTTLSTPVDTLIFTDDGKFERRNNTLILSGTYNFDETGENITFSGTPNLTQKISYIRVTTIGLLVSDTTVGTGTAKIRTVVEDQLSKF
ncbi:hypothetical protein FA048_17385 [Pedobacter polaris]|uniref:Lipocalin-like domain-containing protein n=1 Tax=Pedobacter polaris TaxID=2571273 RepID=A0A4U1CFU8_9SPHI|nr:hypothetical protein [Pedobacter polaris]TKC05498.1 hypothetical protein FA048_17385 [Pedobacter polaris]